MSSALISALAGEWRRQILPKDVERLAGYVDLLLLWNARINLTGASSAEEVITEHLPDSFALAALTPPGAKVVDIGSGGGLPALPFAILRPDCDVTLVEPRGKRVAFLRTALRGLAVTATVLARRLEECALADFDVAGSKATFPPAEWLVRGSKLVAPSGFVAVFVGAEVPDPTAGLMMGRKLEYSAGPGRARALVSYVPRGTHVQP